MRVLLLGDSITRTLGPGLSHASRPEYGVSIANHATLGCDLDADLEVRISGEPGPATPGCPDWRGEWPFLAAALHPEVVALGLGRWEAVDHYYDGQWVHVGEPVWDQHVAADLRAAISIFRTFGARVVLFTMPYIDPPNRQPDGLAWPENTPTRARAYNAVVRQVAGSNAREVSVVDLNQMLSPEGVFTANLSGVPVRWSDGVHITISGGELLRRKILPEFDRIGLADEAVLRTHR